MSTNNISQTAAGVSEATEVIQAAADGAQPVSTPTIAEAAATATALEPAPIVAEVAEPSEPISESALDADASAEGDEMDFGKILAAHEQTHSSEINENEVVKGRVVKITDQVVVIDVGYKSEGIVPINEFKDGDKISVQPGDEIDVFVKQLENNEGYVELSRADALRLQTWDQIERAGKDGTNVIGRVTDRIKGGLRVDIGGIQAFLPGSQVDVRPVRNLDSFRNKEIEVRVIKVNKKRGNIVLSRKVVLEEVVNSKKKETLTNLEEGIVVEGQVKNITEYGAFIELEPGVEGLVHVTEMSWSKRVKHPSKLVGPGQEVEAVVLEVDQHNRRISLGIKQIEPNPWDTIAARYAIGTRVKGRVRNLTDFGAFVEIEDGIDGLVHVSDISWTKRIKHPSEALKKNQEVEAVITAIDIEGRRLSLSIKDLEPNAWDRFFDTHRLGDVVSGKVTRFANFGAFVELEDGIEGLCHVSELSEQHVDKPEDAIKVGQKQQFKILKMDREARKIGLSSRAVGKDEPILDVRNYSSGDSGMAGLFEVADYNKG